MAKVTRRCGCRDEAGKQYGSKCPKLKNYRHGTWGFKITAGADETGKRRYITDFSHGSAEDAEEALGKVKAQLKRKAYSFEKTTVKSYLTGWLDSREKHGEIKPSTARMYRAYIEKDILPSMGGVELRKVTKSDAADLIRELRESDRGAVTIRRIHATLSSAFADAVANGKMQDNPCAGLILPKADKKRLDVWGRDDTVRFLETAQAHRLGVLFELAILTGMRRGEICGLRWSDVDLVERRIIVRTQLVQVGRETVETTIKTEAGQHRVVGLSDHLVGLLMGWQIRQDDERTAWGEAYQDSGRVFTYEDGRELRPGYPSKVLETMVGRLGIPHMRFHDLRHLFASIQLQQGTTIGVVSKMMGHSNSAITLDLYSHMIDDTAQRAADAAAAWLRPTQNSAHAK